MENALNKMDTRRWGKAEKQPKSSRISKDGADDQRRANDDDGAVQATGGAELRPVTGQVTASKEELHPWAKVCPVGREGDGENRDAEIPAWSSSARKRDFVGLGSTRVERTCQLQYAKPQRKSISPCFRLRKKVKRGSGVVSGGTIRRLCRRVMASSPGGGGRSPTTKPSDMVDQD